MPLLRPQLPAGGPSRGNDETCTRYLQLTWVTLGSFCRVVLRMLNEVAVHAEGLIPFWEAALFQFTVEQLTGKAPLVIALCPLNSAIIINMIDGQRPNIREPTS